MGRQARDAMLGLAKTCKKFKIPFFDYLGGYSYLETWQPGQISGREDVSLGGADEGHPSRHSRPRKIKAKQESTFKLVVST
jgi:hypothetical protein